MTTGRRRFIAKAGGVVAAAAAAAVVDAPNVISQPKVQWRMSTTWTASLDLPQGAAQRTARYYYYPGWHEPGTTLDFGFNKKAYEALPIDLRRVLEHASAAICVYGRTEHQAKNAIALHQLRTEFKGKVEVIQLPVPVLRDLKKLSVEVVKEQSEKTLMARKVHASFTRFQALVGPWDHVAEGAYHQLVAG